jgi:DNA polymerase sigma
MQKTKEQILQDLKSKLALKFDDEIQDVFLFGSFSEKLQLIDSNFDILIILKNSFSGITKSKIRNIC